MRVQLYTQRGFFSLGFLMSNGVLSSSGGGLLSRDKAESSPVGVPISTGEVLSALALCVPQFYSWDAAL